GNQLRAMQLALIIFGTGFGFYTFGALSLMVVMTTDKEAGAYLGLWTVCILVFRGLGIGLGSVARDVFLALTGAPAFTYALIFALSAAGLVVAALLLSRQAVLSFARDSGRLPTDELPLTPGLDL
ncbi:MAG: PucC family protein, partial [Candidatus Promineifilaceae bacterium]|nr:PucC family protein [Candidatus Promineifilaceae bacterium]